MHMSVRLRWEGKENNGEGRGDLPAGHGKQADDEFAPSSARYLPVMCPYLLSAHSSACKHFD